MNNLNYNVFTDGASRGNPGPSAAAYVVYQQEQIIHEQAIKLSPTTNNTAEYTALLNAAMWLVQNTFQANIHFYADSELMVKQITGVYKIKETHLRDLANQINEQLSRLSSWSISHVPRSQNQRADYLCNQILDQKN